MYIYSIPDSESVRDLTNSLLYIRMKEPQWFYNDFEIGFAYGCPCRCIWNGGRITAERATLENFKNIVLLYKCFKIKYRVTFTNLLLEKKHLDDYTGNAMAALLEEMGGCVMVASEIMAEYIQKKYPSLPVSWSTTTDFAPTIKETIEVINRLSEDRIVVLPYEFNNNYGLLKQFTHRENLEILLNETCHSHCPKRKEHERNISEGVLYGTTENNCFYKDEYLKPGRRQHNVRASNWEMYHELGINRFKIVGRVDKMQTYMAYQYYLVTGYHRSDVANFMEYQESDIQSFFSSGGYLHLMEV